MSANGNRYTEDQQFRAMLVLALEGGSVKRALPRLAGEGITPAAETLMRWRNSPRYLEIRETHARDIEKGLVDDYREIAQRSVALQKLAMDQAIEEAEAKKLKDPGKTAHSAAIAGAVAVDKLMLFTDRPTQIVSTGDTVQNINAIARRLGITIDTTAEELPPFEIGKASVEPARNGAAESG